MFSQYIRSTPLTGSFQDSYYKNILVNNMINSSRSDNTLLSTARAIIHPRLDGDYYIEAKSIRTRNTVNDMWEDLQRETSANNALFFLQLRGFSDKIEEIKSCFDGNFVLDFKGFREISNVGPFFKNQFWARCFVNDETRTSIVVTTELSITGFHYIQCGIPAFLPWFFDPKDGLSEIELRLIKSLAVNDRNGGETEYLNCLRQMVPDIDFRVQAIKESLRDVEMVMEKERESVLTDKIERVTGDIRSTKEYLATLIIDKEQFENELFGIRMKMDNTATGELMDLFLRDKKLVFERINGRELTFGVKAYVEYYNEDSLIKALDNPHSYIYIPESTYSDADRYARIIPPDDMRKLMTAVFIDREIKLRFCAKYKLCICSNLEALSGQDFSDTIYDNYMPNPHVNRYACLGSHENEIYRCLENRNLIGAIQQCVASCKNINFNDPTVCAEFMREIYGMSDHYQANNCFELPDGSLVSAKEAIEYLKGERKDGAEN